MIKMATGARLTDKEIEKFLASCDDEIELDDDQDQNFEDSNVSDDELLEVDEYSSSDEPIDSDEDDVPLNTLICKSNIVPLSKSILRGKDNHTWSTIKPKSHHNGLNIVHQVRGPTRQCKNITDPLQCFQMFITNEIINEIVRWTNVEIANRKSISLAITDEPQRKQTSQQEISSLIGILVLTAVKKDQHLSTDELFNRAYSGAQYLSTMTKARFRFLLSCLRFDDKAVRILQVGDKFAPIRKVSL